MIIFKEKENHRIKIITAIEADNSVEETYIFHESIAKIIEKALLNMVVDKSIFFEISYDSNTCYKYTFGAEYEDEKYLITLVKRYLNDESFNTSILSFNDKEFEDFQSKFYKVLYI